MSNAVPVPNRSPETSISGRASIVRARGLVKEFPGCRAVDGIDFDIGTGSCFGFLGPNGAGKTTVLKMLLGLSPQSAGELSVYGIPVPARAREVRARTGVVPQIDNLDPDFTVEENLSIYATYFGLPADQGHIDRLLDFAALSERRGAKTDTLSGGMQRRLTIARALVNRPDLVVLDEPTTGLDPQARHVIWSRLTELREQGTTLVLTTHYMEEAERLCDEIILMDHGRILDQGSPEQLVRRHLEPEVIELRGDHAARFSAAVQDQACRVERMGSSLYCYTSDSAGLLSALKALPGLTYMHRPTGLEDVFLKLTGRELRD